MRTRSPNDDKGRHIYAFALIALAVVAVFLMVAVTEASDDSDANEGESFIADDISYLVKTESDSTGTVSVQQNKDGNNNMYAGIG